MESGGRGVEGEFCKLSSWEWKFRANVRSGWVKFGALGSMKQGCLYWMFEIRARKGVRGHPRFGTRLSVEFAWIKRERCYSYIAYSLRGYTIMLYENLQIFFPPPPPPRKNRNVIIVEKKKLGIILWNCYKEYYSRGLINTTEWKEMARYDEKILDSRLEFAICQGLFDEGAV